MNDALFDEARELMERLESLSVRAGHANMKERGALWELSCQAETALRALVAALESYEEEQR